MVSNAGLNDSKKKFTKISGEEPKRMMHRFCTNFFSQNVQMAFNPGFLNKD